MAGVFHAGPGLGAGGCGNPWWGMVLFSGGQGYLEPGVVLRPQECGALGPIFSPGASAGCGGRGGAARLGEAATAGSTWLPRGWEKEGVWALHPGLPGVLSPQSPASWGLIEALGREMLGRVAGGGAKIVGVFVQCLTSVMAVLIYRALFFVLTLVY